MSTIQETFLLADGAVDRAQVAVVIPTFNAGRLWERLKDGLRIQGIPANQVLIMDSSSEDGTRDLAAAEGFEVVRIDRCDFNHGGTRQAALGYVPWASIVVYLTQDAVLATPDSIDRLLSAFEDERVAVAYGRQLPRQGAGPIEAHARLFNYPPRSDVRDFESRHALGIKATFLSNSFSAYRVDALREIGGFPSHVIVSEDTLVTGKLLLAGWKAAYVAEAQVYHSHALTISEEFQRYFDIGVGHRRASWLSDCFGKPAGEGRRFVMSELAFLGLRYPHLIPIALLRTTSKALGYQLGLREAKLGRDWSRRLSHHKSFWDRTVMPCEGHPSALPGSEIPTSAR
jgi:rhamnosyltransferase